MTEPKRALTDLRSTAQAEFFADWRVTPELRAKLRRRIEAEAPGAPVAAKAPAPTRRKNRLSPWVRWGGTATAAVAAVMALVMLGQSPSLLSGPRTQSEGSSFLDQYGNAAAPEQKQAVPAQPGSAAKETLVGNAVSYQSAPSITGAPVQPAGQPMEKGVSFTVTAADADRGAPTTTVTNTSATVPGAAPTVPATESQPGRKIILNAEYSLEVKDAVTAMQRLQTLAATTAGYMVDAALNKGQDGSWAGRLTLRLPASLYNGAITEIRTIGDVKQERQWSQDVTERYYDLEARIRIQQEYEQKLQELAAKAATFDDWMKLTRQVNDTRALIEQMQGSIKLLANQVEYSTINISFFQPAPDQVPPPKPPEPAKGLWPAMARSFSRSVQWFAGLGEALLVGAAAFAPFLAALLLLAVVAFAVLRRLRLRQPPTHTD